MEKIISHLKFLEVPKNEILIQAQQNLNKIILVIKGSLSYGGEIFEKGSAFGENFLLQEKDSKTRELKHDLSVVDDCEIAYISINRFHKIIGGTLKQAISKNVGSHEVKMLQDDDKFRNGVKQLKLKDLIFIKKLGEGQFGHVFLVKTIDNDQLYALKVVSKAQIVSQNLETHTLVSISIF